MRRNHHLSAGREPAFFCVACRESGTSGGLATKSAAVNDPRVGAIPDIHGHAKGEHKPYVEERPIPYSARMLFLWFYHAARRGHPRFMMVADHINYLTFEDPAAVNLVRRALKLAAARDLYGAAETAGVDLHHAAVVSEGLRRGMRFVIGAEVDNDPRARPDATNIVEAMKPDGLIRSIHFLPIEHPVHGAGWQWPFDHEEFRSLYETVGTQRVWELYMAALLDAIEKQPAQIVGHFYAPAKFGHWPDQETLERYEDQVVAACRERGMALEINMRFYYRYFDDEQDKKRYFDGNLRLMKKAKEHGVGIAIGSDAHSPKDQGEGFDLVLRMLDEAEVNELVFPIGGRLARVALRAAREPVQEPVPARIDVPAAEAEEGEPEERGPQKRARRERVKTKTPRPPAKEAKPKQPPREVTPARETKPARAHAKPHEPKRKAQKAPSRSSVTAKRRETPKAAGTKAKPAAKKAAKGTARTKAAPGRPAARGKKVIKTSKKSARPRGPS